MTFSHTRTPASAQRGALQLGVGFGAYAAAAVWLSASGAYGVLGVNAFAITIALATLGLSLSYFLSPSVALLARRLGPYGLASFHVWRIFAALTFLFYGSQGWLPETYVNQAGWGDMLAGVLAAVVLMIPRRAPTIAGFHIIGFTDFLIAVGTGVTLNAIAPESMTNIANLPVSLIPLIGVPLSGATHIAALHLLATDRTAAAERRAA